MLSTWGFSGGQKLTAWCLAFQLARVMLEKARRVGHGWVRRRTALLFGGQRARAAGTRGRRGLLRCLREAAASSRPAREARRARRGRAEDPIRAAHGLDEAHGSEPRGLLV